MKLTNSLSSERGINQYGLLFLLLIVFAVGFTAWQVGPFYYYYYDILGLMEAQAKKAQVLSDREIRQNIEERIRKDGIPVDNPREDLKIAHFGNKLILDLKYQEVFYITYGENKDYTFYVFNFNPHAEGPSR